MSSVNKVILVGHLGRDPEVRRLQSGAPVVSISIATAERWTDKATGEKRDRTEWHDVVIYNENICKVAEQYLRKGSKVYVEGQLNTREWTDSKTGEKRRRTEVLLQAYRGELALLDSKRESAPLDNPRESGGDYAAMKGGANPSHPAGGAAPRATLDDDIPF